MSGPKCLELRMMPLADARRNNRAQCDVFLAQYGRFCDQLAGFHAELRTMGIEREASWLTTDELGTKVNRVFAESCADGLAALQFVLEQKRAVEVLIERFKNEIRDCLVNAQKQHRLLCDRVETIEQARRSLTALARAVPADWPEQVRARIKASIDDALKQSPAMSAESLTLDREGLRRLDADEKRSAEAARQLDNAHQYVERAINETHSQLVTNKLVKNISPTLSLSDYMKSKGGSDRVREDKVFNKLDSLMADVAMLKNTASWESLVHRAATIRKETDAGLKRGKYESLVLECGDMIRGLRECERWRKEVEELIDSAAHVKAGGVTRIIGELEMMLRAGRVVKLTGYRASLKQAIANEERRNDREQRRQAVLESLTAMGYEVEADKMETALISAGKVYIRKPGERDYAIEVVADAEFSLVQTAMVRFAESAEPTQQQQLRDKEAEVSWCGEHARLRTDLEARGIGSQFRLEIPAGEQPVRVVLDSGRVRRNRTDSRMSGNQNRQMRAN